MPVSNQTHLIASIKADLIARKVIPNPQTSHEHALLITAYVAAATNGKLNLKPQGTAAEVNGVRYSTDVIVYPDGWVDMLASAGPPTNENRPVWQWHSAGPPRPETVADPQVVINALDPMTPEEPEPERPDTGGTVPMPDLVAIITSAVKVSLANELDLLHTELDEIKALQMAGLSGSLFGYTLTLKPPVKKANGRG